MAEAIKGRNIPEILAEKDVDPGTQVPPPSQQTAQYPVAKPGEPWGQTLQGSEPGAVPPVIEPPPP